jgi:DNA-binding FadR family transcriptional regulator
MNLFDAIAGRITDAQIPPGSKLPTEAAIMAEFGVSRTVVREALSRLQATGLVHTRHGVGTFVHEIGERGRIDLGRIAQASALLDVVAVLELRLGLECEDVTLAAERRTKADLEAMRKSLSEFSVAIDEDGDTIAPDLRLHRLIAQATCNVHFVELTDKLAGILIPRARVDSARLAGVGLREYLQRVHAEHESIVDAIDNRDPETARALMRIHLSNSRNRLRRAQKTLDRKG